MLSQWFTVKKNKIVFPFSMYETLKIATLLCQKDLFAKNDLRNLQIQSFVVKTLAYYLSVSSLDDSPEYEESIVLPCLYSYCTEICKRFENKYLSVFNLPKTKL